MSRLHFSLDTRRSHQLDSAGRAPQTFPPSLCMPTIQGPRESGTQVGRPIVAQIGLLVATEEDRYMENN